MNCSPLSETSQGMPFLNGKRNQFQLFFGLKSAIYKTLLLLLFKKWSRFIGILFTLERQPIIAFQTENAFPTKQMLKPCKWNTMKHSEKQWNARYNYANETHDETMKMKHSEKKNNETHNITMQMKYTMNPCKWNTKILKEMSHGASVSAPIIRKIWIKN